MGFFDSLMNAAMKAQAKQNKMMEKVQQTRDNQGYDDMSDSELRNIYNSKSSSWDEKYGAGLAYKDRHNK